MKVAELFVNVLPDMGGFQGTLNKALTDAESKSSVEVEVLPDVSNLAKDIAKAAKKAEPDAVKIPVEVDKQSNDRAIGVVDTLGSRAGIAAGGIGDLSGALEAQGIISEGVATAMGTAAATVQGFAGVADLALISVEALKGAKAALAAADIKATASAAASKAATVAMTAVTWLQTAAMGALNAVMSLNPFALVVIAITALVAAFVVLFNKNQAFHDLVIKVWDAIKNAIAGAWNNFIKPAFDAIWGFIQNSLLPIFQKLWDIAKMVFEKIADTISWLWNTVIQPIFGLWWSYITDVLIPIIMKLWDIIKGAFDKIADIIGWVWENVIKKVFDAIKHYITDIVIPVFQKIWDFIKTAFEGVGNAIQWVWDNVIKKVFDAIKSGIDTVKSGFQTAVDGIKTIWDGLKKIVAVPVNFVIGTIWNNGLRKVINMIPFIDDLPEIAEVKFAQGGVLPGFTPGRDVHHFTSPTGGALALSGGEGIMRPEWVRAMGGAKAVAAMNARARKGLPPVEMATGGIVMVDGEKMTQVAAAQLRVAEQHWKDMKVMQGSYQPPTSYSGTSHTGGGVMDTSPGSFAAQKILREVGFAAWGRNFAGAKTAGSGAHVHSVSLFDPMARGNAQARAYLAGQDGLGGRDYGPRPAVNDGYMKEVAQLIGSGVDLNSDDGGHWWDQAIALFKKIKDSLTASIEGGFFKVADLTKGLANSVIDFANSKIPFFDPIPRLAKGGIVSRPTIGMLGEAGPEAVVPLSGRGGRGALGPAVVIQNYNASSTIDIDALMQRTEFYVRAGRV